MADKSIPLGSGEQAATVDGQVFDVFTFRPSGCEVTGILMVFYGVDRNAATYRNDAIPTAQRYCLLAVVPLFDQARFPGWRYQRGGVVHDGSLQPAPGWITSLVPGFATWAGARAGRRPGLPYVVMGHSAGAQFLSRVAAYGPGEARLFVIANPSTWVRPRLDVPAPYGFGPPFPPGEAEAQGATRVEPGRTVFAEAEQAARQHGRPFNWRLSVLPGVGHNARRMLTAPGVLEGLAP